MSNLFQYQKDTNTKNNQGFDETTKSAGTAVIPWWSTFIKRLAVFLTAIWSLLFLVILVIGIRDFNIALFFIGLVVYVFGMSLVLGSAWVLGGFGN